MRINGNVFFDLFKILEKKNRRDGEISYIEEVKEKMMRNENMLDHN